jgi:hypothetical protein
MIGLNAPNLFLKHPRPDYDPAPIALGSFELFPTLELGEYL